MKKFGIICGVFLISISCGTSKKSFVIEASSSGCYGSCPILDLKFRNGEIYYNLIKYNKKEGLHKYILTERENYVLDSLFLKINFNTLKNKYISFRQDMQVYNTRILIRDKEKYIYYYKDDAPTPYENLIDYLIDLKEKDIIALNDTIIYFPTREKFKNVDMPIPPMPNVD